MVRFYFYRLKYEVLYDIDECLAKAEKDNSCKSDFRKHLAENCFTNEDEQEPDPETKGKNVCISRNMLTTTCMTLQCNAMP